MGFGSGRVELAGPSTLIVGTDGVTEIEGALIFGPRDGAGDSFTAIVGTDGVTETLGTFTFGPREGAGDSLTEIIGISVVAEIGGGFTLELLWPGPLVEIDGVSWTAIDGTGVC